MDINSIFTENAQEITSDIQATDGSIKINPPKNQLNL